MLAVWAEQLLTDSSHRNNFTNITSAVMFLDNSSPKLKQFDMTIFAELPKLRTLSLSHGQGQVDDIVTHKPLMIEQLDLSYNNLKFFPATCSVEFGNFSKERHSLFPKLKILKLNFNRLRSLGMNGVRDAKPCLPNLTSLQLIGNYITDINAMFFKGFPKLMYLKLEHQRRIQDKIVAYNLNLPENFLGPKAFSQTVLVTPRLKVLYLNGNSIDFKQAVRKDIFSNCKNVQILDVSQNIFRQVRHR